MEALQFVIEPPFDMRYARTTIALEWVLWLQSVLYAVLRRGTVLTGPEDALGQEVLYSYDDLYIYRYWLNRSAKELSIELRLWLRFDRLSASWHNVELFDLPIREQKS